MHGNMQSSELFLLLQHSSFLLSFGTWTRKEEIKTFSNNNNEAILFFFLGYIYNIIWMYVSVMLTYSYPHNDRHTQENDYHLCRRCRCCYFCWPADTKIVEYKCTCEVSNGWIRHWLKIEERMRWMW